MNLNLEPGTWNLEPGTWNLTAHTPMIVLRAEAFEQRDRLGERLHALDGPVGHVDRGLAAAAHGFHVRALRHQVPNQIGVSPGRGVMEPPVTVLMAASDVR